MARHIKEDVIALDIAMYPVTLMEVRESLEHFIPDKRKHILRDDRINLINGNTLEITFSISEYEHQTLN